jgi:hypothetical protein
LRVTPRSRSELQPAAAGARSSSARRIAAVICFVRNAYSCGSAGPGASRLKKLNGSVAVSRLGAVVLRV